MKESEELQLHNIAITKDVEAIVEAVFNGTPFFAATVCEEDPDQDLEREILRTKLNNTDRPPTEPKFNVWAFSLDDRTDGASIWLIMSGPDFDSVRRALESIPHN